MGKITALLVLGALLATLGAGAGAQTAGTFLSFSSDPGDYIGGGQSRYFTPDTAAFQARADDTNRYVNVSVFPFDGGFWYLDLAAPQGQPLVPGVYEGAARYPFQSPSQPGLSFVGDGRGCNTVTGRFQVLEALYGPERAAGIAGPFPCPYRLDRPPTPVRGRVPCPHAAPSLAPAMACVRGSVRIPGRGEPGSRSRGSADPNDRPFPGRCP